MSPSLDAIADAIFSSRNPHLAKSNTPQQPRNKTWRALRSQLSITDSCD